jgi:hypothetical protein
MNCQNFETMINDLARGQMMDAAARDSALAHSSACARCAARLADEKMLSAGLRRLAAGANAEEAPARVEARLLAALREQRTLAPSIAVVGLPSRRFRRLAISAAAAVLIVLALAAIRFDQPDKIKPVERAQEMKPNHRLAPPNKPETVERGPELATRHRTKNPRRVAARHPKESPARAVDSGMANEIATDFIPLVQGDSLTLMESGQLVRVELPRSALISFGLPMNMERAYERVKADVVVGNDGLARAIRFVR